MKTSRILLCAMLCISALYACGKTDHKNNVSKPETESAQTVDAAGKADNEDTMKQAVEDENRQTDKEEDALGLTLTTKNVSRTGMVLVFTQSGGSPSGELYTGSYFRIEQYTDGEWQEMPYVFEGETVWTAEAWGIPQNTTVEYPEKWVSYYGILPNGRYRIAKEIDDFRQPGDFDKGTYYAMFEITDKTPAARINVNGITYTCKGEISEFNRTCGTMDGFIQTTAAADAKKLEPNQSNFGEGFGYQRVNDTQYDVPIGSVWYAFIAEGSDAKTVKPTYNSEVVCPIGEDALKTAYPITAEESVTLHTILSGANWVEGTADCINDYRLDLSDISVYYHSECGTFNDPAHERSFSLDDETRELVNRIVFQYTGA